MLDSWDQNRGFACWDQLSSKTSSKPCKLCCGTWGATVWLPTTAKPIQRCFINLPWHTIYCQGKFKVISSQCFQSYHITKEWNVSRCSAVTWDTCSALINLLLWSCVCNSNELIELMASSTSWLFTYQTVAPSRWICVSFSTGGQLFLWSNFISISCSSYYGIVIGTMGTQWNSPFYSTDPASCMSLTYICWLCWNKWAFIPGNLAEAMQLRKTAGKYSIYLLYQQHCQSVQAETEGMYFSFCVNCKTFCKYMLVKHKSILKQHRLQISSCYRVTGKI